MIPHSMIGQTLGHYRITEKIAAGGMGVVYRARDEQLERDVALKLLPPGTLRDDSARRQFRNEALVLAQLNHPNIETVYEFDTEDGVDFLVMEYVPGKTLADRLASGPLLEKEIIALGMQIVAALEDAHERGIVHRDLKPANIAIAAKGQAKVLDFGLAKLLHPSSLPTTDNLLETQAGAGTLPYMSPEQLRGGAVDARTDIYTAGVVLYEMATNRRPFDDPLPSRFIDAIFHQPPVPPRAFNPRISVDLERIILKCLDKEPDHRYQSAKELFVDLRRLSLPSTAPVIVPIAPKSIWRRFTPYAAGALLVLAATIAVFNRDRLRERIFGAPSSRVRSLVVLPMENRSGDPDQQYFADGVTEALMTDLAQISELRVISRTSAMHYKGTKKTVPEIARELNIDAIVEGSVQRSGDRVQINAQLIHAPTDRHLWAASFERDVRNLLSLQSEVASAIATAVQIKLTAQEKGRLAEPRAVNPEAYEAYLRGRYHWNEGGQDQREKAKAYFEQAVALDPNYAPPYAGLADYHWATSELSPRLAIPKARELVLKALSLDASLAHAHASMAAIRFFGDWDWNQAEKEFQIALALNPSNAESHQLHSVFLSSLERPQEALLEVQRAQELDPLSLLTNVTFGWTYYFTGQYDRAIEHCRNALNLDRNSVGAHDCLGQSFRAQGNYDQAIAESKLAAAFSRDEPGRAAGLACVYAAAGRRSDAQAILDELLARGKQTYVSPYFTASIFSCLNQPTQAFAALQKAFQEHDPYLTSLKIDPAFAPLRSDPRFGELAQRIGFPR